MKFIKTHKVLSIMVGILIIIFLVCFVILYKMFFSYSNDKYKNRLKNIENVKISQYTVKKIESELQELEHVESVKYSLKGKLITIWFDVSKDLDKDNAKDYGDKVLEYFTEEERQNYDIQIFIVATEEEEEPKYPIIGYLKAKRESIVWTNN